MPESQILLDVTGPIATITLNRPAKRNALTRAMLNELRLAFDRLDGMSELRVVVLQGAGQSFCAGLDLTEMLHEREACGSIDHGLLEGVLNRLDHHCNPTIAVIQGPALAGGCELALHCDVRIASPEASIGMPLARVGIVVPSNLARRLVDTVGIAAAYDLLLTGESVDGARAFQLGLVTRLASAETLAERTSALARRLAANAPLAVLEMKRLLRWTAETVTASICGDDSSLGGSASRQPKCRRA